MKKKVLSLVLALMMIFAFSATLTGCGSDSGSSDFKVGFICLHDENSTYDKNFIDAANAACDELGVEAVIKTNIPEGQECYDAAAELVDAGCDIIFADSFGHEDFMIQAAKDFPDVQFCHSTGTKAHTEKLDNYHNAFASIYEGRYLAGVAAGMKINEMIENGDITADQAKIGYVGAYPYAEVVSGYTAFFQGIKSVYEDVTMDVQYTNSWFDITAEGEAANALMSRGCVIIGQHADSTGAPAAVEAAQKKGTVAYSVGYNIDMLSVAPNAALTSSTNEWGVYYEYAFNCLLKGETIKTDWSEGYNEGAVAITKLGDSCAEGTQEAVDKAIEGIKDGSVKVFDVSKFTVAKGDYYKVDGDGHLTSCKAIDTDGDFTPDKEEAIEDGAFQESKFRSAPYFQLRIDGINELNAK